MKLVLVTGGFDPIHSGHIEYFKAAKKLGDKLIVGLNSDEWLARKKGQPFMPIEERFVIVASIDVVDEVIVYNDDDGSSIDAIRLVKISHPDDEIIFANGGDRTAENIPEMTVHDVEFVFGVGGENKMNSSSWILREWKQPKTLRQWGYYRVLHDVPGCKVKELTIEPGKSLSMQKHFKRNEHWLVTEGKCNVLSILSSGYTLPTTTLSKHNSYHVPLGEWHQLSNPYNEACRIIEIQYGEACIEEDIERKE
jgi:cytidyltransferase-like protein